MSCGNRQIEVVCFGGEDWWYHNHGHIDFQLMRRFAQKGTVLYINSLVMQKPRLVEGRSFLKKVFRKLKSIFRRVSKSEWGFWVYSPLSVPLHYFWLGRQLNRIIVGIQVRFVMKKLGVSKPIIWVACPAACEIALDIEKKRLVYQRTDRFEEFPNTTGY
jgi:hypothetical protein